MAVEKMRMWALAIAAAVFLAFFAGCTSGQPQADAQEPPEPPELPANEVVPPWKPSEWEQPQAANQTEPPKVEELPPARVYNDSANGITFTYPEGTELLGPECKYWGGSSQCDALARWNTTRKPIAELSSKDARLDARGLQYYLDYNGLLKRTQAGVWYDVKFGSLGAIVFEAENTSKFDGAAYIPIAGKVRIFSVSADGKEGARAAKETWESLRIGGKKASDHYPVKFECNFDHNCLPGEKCVSRTICTALDPNNRELVDYFGSEIGCISGGPDICRRLCSNDSDCPRGQTCHTLTQQWEGRVRELTQCV